MAALTVALVVRGPGVNSSLLVVMAEVLFFVAVAVIDARNQMVDCRLRVRRRLPDVLSAHVGGVHDDVLDIIRRNLARVFAQHGEIGQFAGRDRSLVLLFESGVGAVERPHLDGLFHA